MIRQVWMGKANASEPLMTCRKTLDVIETSVADMRWDQFRRCLLTA